MKSADTFKTLSTLRVGSNEYSYYSLPVLEKKLGVNLKRLPVSLRILLENLLRQEDGRTVTTKDIEALVGWTPKGATDKEISFMPARVILQDFTGVPCIVDLAVMRDAMKRLGGNPDTINPLQQVDLVIDHSVQVDEFGTEAAFLFNVGKEFERNRERYEFLRWGQQAFRNFSVVPPGTGIVHQVNLEYLASVVYTKIIDGVNTTYPDTLVGTDSHTTMINGLGVLGWGVGGIEAEAAMLGQPISMLIPEVVGFKLHGSLPAGATATDLVLTATQILRKKGVVGKFVEFYGPGISTLPIADRATIANMAPEYGATMGFFPVDQETLSYLRFTGRTEALVRLVETYYKEQDLFHTKETPEPEFSDTLELDLATVEPSMAGPKRPQDRVTLGSVRTSFRKTLLDTFSLQGKPFNSDDAKRWLEDPSAKNLKRSVTVPDADYGLEDGAVVIAAITSCTNTSNPSVMIGAGLLAKKAAERGLKSKSWVKTSLAPGSKVVREYLTKSGLLKPLEVLGFHIVGYGCTTCIGNSGPLPEQISASVQENDLVVAAVLSGNRNFEGRVNAQVRANYLASPPLVVAYALAGTVDIDLSREPLGIDKNGAAVYLKDIWPSPREIEETIRESVSTEMFTNEYGSVFEGTDDWKNLPVPTGSIYRWDPSSTYIKAAPYFDNISLEPAPKTDIVNAKVLAVLGDSITTDHISPAGSISSKSPAAAYLRERNVETKDFNSYGSRRGNHEVMMRGTFANVRLRNQLAPGTEGGWTVHPSSAQPMTIFDAAMLYRKDNVPTIIIAGKEYGSGSSRDWAAKGPKLLGVTAVIAESFERIHRSNLVGMGVLPLQFKEGESLASLGLSGKEFYTIDGIGDGLKPHQVLTVQVSQENGVRKSFSVIARIDTPNEVDYYYNDGILPFVLRNLLKKPAH